MATTPTRNAVPSEQYSDLRFNAGKLDEFITSTEDEYTDRLGITHLTVRGIQNSVADALLPENNLSDVQSTDSSLQNLGGGETGIAVFKGATPAAIRSTLLAAARGANSDITSITGLTTALAISQGGTGGTSASAARVALGAKANTGVTDASNAASGVTGEYLSGTLSSTSLTSGAVVNAASLVLTPGDWDVNGAVQFDNSATMTSMQAGTSLTSATSQGFPFNSAISTSISAGTQRMVLPARRVNVNANTTIYAVATAGFASGTCTVNGFISARRIR
ncbi:hypothetical protein [Leclercia sp.]|uniref:hypothetical protein n=1 Tax=Leclercia sp. TaxID=1898428 RepID=UPI0028A9EE4E|nr:hypothetical protein [Leclercia sp.]